MMDGQAPRPSGSVSLAEARRIALAAQGFGRPRMASEAARPALRRMIERLGVVQIDSVNVLARAQTLPAFSRLGRYRTEDLQALAYSGRRSALFEYWGHEASLLPVGLQPLMRWRMARAARGEDIYGDLARFGCERQALIEEVRREVADRGPLAAQELTHRHKGAGGWWGWSDGKRALEWLFWAGIVTTANRRATFERVYDLTERVLPMSIIAAPTPDEAEAQRELMKIAACALGIATERCLRDYFRLGVVDARRSVSDLVEAGVLIPTSVEGWKRPAFLHKDARCPRRLQVQALLAPFDPLIWQRERTEALFGARIRLELYTPRAKRTHGYYVLPLLLGDRIGARVDLKADRPACALRVLAVHIEPGIPAAAVIAPLGAELRLMASWLGLHRITVARRGDGAAELRTFLR
jgi:uncharacterized protein